MVGERGAKETEAGRGIASGDSAGRGRSPVFRRFVRGLALGGGLAGLLVLFGPTAPLELLEARTYDLRARWSADATKADTSIVFVDVDPASLQAYQDRLGRWPWPRDAHAAIVQYLVAAGARMIVFDVLFPEADVRDPASDSALADALDLSGDVILPMLLNRGTNAVGGGEPLTDGLARFALPSSPPAEGEPRFPIAEPPHPSFSVNASALGSVNLNPDPDGVVRGDRVAYRHGELLLPSLGLAAARRLEPTRFGGAAVVEPGRALRLGDLRIPLDDGRMLIRWRGPYLEDGRSTYRIHPAFRILNSFDQVLTGRDPDVPPESLRDKIVFVGVTAAGTEEFDARPTPIRPFDPGVLIHATVLDNLLAGDWMTRAPRSASAAVTVLTGLGVGVAASVASPWLAAVGSALLGALALTGVAVAFGAGVWLDLAAPLLAVGLAFAGSVALNWATEGREKRRVRELFGRYVSPEYVRRLADDFETIRLGGERLPITLLFSDIRGFTTLSERLPAEVVVELLNEYLERMTEIVFRHGGTLDKFIGDAVMAFWGAPVADAEHPRRAIDAALDMLDEVDALNRRWRERGNGVELAIGVGIHTGEAIVGNIGSLSRKLDYTAIGDTVNLASRLESLNKDFGTRAIVSEATRSAAGGDYDLRSLGEVRVKGKEQDVEIFELRGRGGKETRPKSPGVATLAGLLLGLILLPADGQAQAKARWTDLVYQPGQWDAGQLVARATTDQNTGAVALTAMVDVYAEAPRWRAEIRRVERGTTLSVDPIVLVADGSNVRVLTTLGATPLAEHAASSDPLVQAVAARFDASGRTRSTGTGRIVETDPSGNVAWVLVRRPAARADFPDELLGSGTAGRLGRSIARFGVAAAGGEPRGEVVASAGARGVARVQTLDGEIQVFPDTAAIQGIESVNVEFLELVRFWQEGGLVNAGPTGGEP